MKHFHWLDLFRFGAALVVMVAHARGTVFVEYSSLVAADKTFLVTAAFAVTRIAHEAVVTFFVLSGFLVGGRALERILEGTFQPADYAVDRLVRIMLPLFPALALTGIVRIAADGYFNFWDLIGNLFSLQGIFFPSFGGNLPLWSLSYEVWFYIMTYAVGVAALKRKFHFSSVFLLILVAAVFTKLDSVYLFCWLIGAMAYLHMPNNFSWQMLCFSVILCVYAIICFQIGVDSRAVSVAYLRSYLPSLNVSTILLSTGISIIIQQVLFLKPENVFMKKLDKTGTVLAASSYTLYLTHYPILGLLTHLGLRRANQINTATIGTFLLTIFICLLSSWVLYFLFEKHTNLIRKILKQRIAKYNSSVAL